MDINFTNLPGDIKSYIYSFNKNKEKHEYLLKKCINEVKDLYHISEKYLEWVCNCVGLSVWTHESDYLYWIGIEFNDIKKHQYYLSKSKLIKLLITENRIKQKYESVWWSFH